MACGTFSPLAPPTHSHAYAASSYTHHQAESADTDSLHLTLSTGRQHTWRDLLQLAVDGALEDASAAHPEWRRSLPHNYLNYMGVIHADTADPQRAAFHTKLHGTLALALAAFHTKLHGAMRPAVTPRVGGCNRLRRSLQPYATSLQPYVLQA